jgi:hypothetical protein
MPKLSERLKTQEQQERDSALSDLTEEAVQGIIDKENVGGWLALRGIHRAGNIAHTNVKDLRRRLGRESEEEVEARKQKVGASKMDEEMKINSPTYPAPIIMQSPPHPQPPQSNGLGKVFAGAAITAAAIGIPGAGVAGYLLSKAFDKPPVTTINNVEDQTTIGLKRLSDFLPATPESDK